MNDEAVLLLALLRTPGIGLITANRLCRAAGSAARLWEERANISRLLPQATDRLQQCLTNWDKQLPQAEAEADEARRRHISLLALTETDYPTWLKSLPDAPPVLFYKGTASLNAQPMISIVGTRHISEYGKDLCRHIVEQLAERLPQATIVSGLAYGVDVHAHRAALACGLPTIGVLGHGLNHLYPPSHRDTANRMTEQGGLLTEYPCATPVSRENFVQRNRIVAGLSQACIVVESARRGGALITACLAQDYGREVYACPGRLTDLHSEGCNRLIARHGAAIFTSVDDLMDDMGWASRQPRPQQLELFPALTATEEQLRSRLVQTEQCSADELVTATGLKVAEVNAALIQLEMKGLVRLLAGNQYRWTGTFPAAGNPQKK